MLYSSENTKAVVAQLSLEHDPTPNIDQVEDECPWCGEDLEDCDCE